MKERLKAISILHTIWRLTSRKLSRHQFFYGEGTGIEAAVTQKETLRDRSEKNEGGRGRGVDNRICISKEFGE